MTGLINKGIDAGTLKSAGVCLAVIIALLATGGCVVYEPVPGYRTYSVDNYDRIWDSALRALQDEGARMTGADKQMGVITGGIDAATITVNIRRQADKTTRVEFNVESSTMPKSEISRISDNLYRSYERNMGR